MFMINYIIPVSIALTKTEDMDVVTFEMKEDMNYFESVCQDFVESLTTKGFRTAPTKLKANSVLGGRKTRNLEAKNPNCARWCKPGMSKRAHLY